MPTVTPSRAGEQAGAVEEAARRLAEAAAAAEREAERARDAAAAAEKAAGVARQAADEAGASRHAHPEERRVISRYEPHADAGGGRAPPLAAVSAEENGQRGGPAPAAAPRPRPHPPAPTRAGRCSRTARTTLPSARTARASTM